MVVFLSNETLSLELSDFITSKSNYLGNATAVDHGVDLESGILLQMKSSDIEGLTHAGILSGPVGVLVKRGGQVLRAERYLVTRTRSKA